MTAASRVGIRSVLLQSDAVAAAPQSGVAVGAGPDGPVSLRLLRAAGTRVVIAGPPLVARLLALRAAVAGTVVRVISDRPEVWEPLVRHGPGSRTLAPPESPLPSDGPSDELADGPSVLVDDRFEPARAAEVRPWLCRIEIRRDWGPAELGSFARADVTVFGAVSAEVALRIASLYGVAANRTEPMTTLDAQSVALVGRGRVEYAALAPTAAEQYVLGRQEPLTASRIAP